MEETKNPMIYEAICKVAEKVGAIGKTARNQQQGFNYRGIDMVMNALHPAFVENGIFVVPQVIETTRENRMTAKGGNLTYTIAKVKYTFYAKDGSSIEAIVYGEGMDTADKSTNKALSVAFKYACFQVFCIPTEEMKDPDADSYDVAPPQKQYICHDCGLPFKAFTSQKGKHFNAGQVYHIAENSAIDGIARCSQCLAKSGQQKQKGSN